MRAGFAPQARVMFRDNKTGEVKIEDESKELHHKNGNRGVPGYDSPKDLYEVWPWQHGAIDPKRFTGYTFIKFMDD